MKVGIYTPYLNTLGGGEKYMLTIAEVLLEKGCEVTLFLGTHLYDLDTEELVQKAEKIHGIDLKGLSFFKGPFGVGSSTTERYKLLKKFDVFFYLTDGSIFYANAKKNILHFQVPFENFNKSIINRIKLKSWQITIFNSIFTKKIVEQYWPVHQGKVLYPPVSTEQIRPIKKENIIISVGRFHMATRTKKHEVMIKAFRNLVEERGIMDWQLVLAGGLEQGNDAYIDELHQLALGLNVLILPNISIQELHRLYGKAKIYWHAAGLGEDDPKKHEHFGITTVEAMAGGCVPIVINKGGQPEIVDTDSGIVWDTLDELLLGTEKIIHSENLRERMALQAIERAKTFDRSHFRQGVLKIVFDNQ